ncbi:FAD-dependent oxygenase [Amycolatopsis camponoti]|uniref:FAD-dependent oxygenase n=1 Tax=Amycolatopsis camponoti TaxID=2606593 RepID=A0A6I8LIX9_9PSEU|nr:FAD-binding oxidoreductase [Amycolatopsis camponoti]VVJ15279.1 FAD-dependent oxygenase [Amycolatopsis camponoti]
MQTFRPGEDGYAEEIAGFQTSVATQPAVVFAPENADDVVAATKYAAEHELPVAVQATGHGLTAGTDGLLISTRRLTGIEIDAGAKTARVEAGVRWGAVIEAAAQHGLAPLSGSSPDVGVVGYTLSGGFGLMARRFGRAADHVRAIDVVTADGDLRTVTPGDDLFWALLGGRAGFGVVTALEFGLVEVTELYGGGLYFDAADLPAVLRAWRTWAVAAPDELTTSIAVVGLPDLPFLPEPIRGKHVANVRIAYLGDDGDQLVKPLRTAAPVLLDTLKRLPYTDSGSIASDPPHPHPYHGTNATVEVLNDAMLASIVEHADTETVLIIDRLGGELARRPAEGVGWDSKAEFVVRALSVVEDDVETIRRAHAKLFDALAPWSTGRLLPFLYGEHSAGELATAFPAGDRARLKQLKAKYDPAGRFG